MFAIANQRSGAKLNQRAFTLVELLVAMVIAGIISSMVAIALSGAKQQAQETRGQAFVDRLNILMLQLYEDEARRATGAPISTPEPYTTSDRNEEAAASRAVSSLIWKRDYLRCALPDRIQDLIDPPIDAYYRVIRRDTTVTPPASIVMLARMDPPYSPTASTPSPPPSWTSVYMSSTRWQSQERYRQRVLSILQAVSPSPPTTFAECVDGNAANGEWTQEHQGAECLYLILATNTINGDPAIDSLRSRDIDDVDEDGIPEVLDPWGTPLGFLRWPCGLYLNSEWDNPLAPLTPSSPSSPAMAALAARKIELTKDTLDVLYSDPRFDDTTSANFQADDPFAMYPTVFSAGGDGVFDMVGVDTPPTSPISYASETFPVAAGRTLGYPGSPRFIDPYQYSVSPADMLGTRKDVVDQGTDNSADNILPSFDFS